MKNLILLIFITFVTLSANGQTTNVDTFLKFDKIITTYERHWVVLKKPETVPYYTFGYVYIQSNRGFMFKPAGQFEINKQDKYVLHAGKISRYMFNPGEIDQSLAARLIRFRDTAGFMNSRQIRPVVAAILSEKHFKELNIEATPQWVKPYYIYTDTLEHNYRWGCYHTEELDFATGISYLEKVYKVSPHYIGVKVPMDGAMWINTQGIEMKLGMAYNSPGLYDKAIAIFKNAIAYNPGNPGFYVELGLVYQHKGDTQAAIDIYTQGINRIKEKSQVKSWFAGVISNIYTELHNEEESKKWRARSYDYSPCPGCVY